MGRIFSIEEFSTFDGPGIRMTVFLKGCPLKCVWCHNPEGQATNIEYYRSPNGCLKCDKCINEEGVLDEKSIDLCPLNLVRRFGEDISANELAEKILKNARILEMNGGGVTFSGGEPTLQGDFLLECLGLLENKVHRAVQTCGYTSPKFFEKLLKNTDMMLFDLKIIDGSAHKKYCGTDNGIIKVNYRNLVKSNVSFVTRIPLIPDITDTQENIEAIAKFMRDSGVFYAELLPYNSLAGAKYSGLLREYDLNGIKNTVSNPRFDIFKNYGIEAKLI